MSASLHRGFDLRKPQPLLLCKMHSRSCHQPQRHPFLSTTPVLSLGAMMLLSRGGDDWTQLFAPTEIKALAPHLSSVGAQHNTTRDKKPHYQLYKLSSICFPFLLFGLNASILPGMRWTKNHPPCSLKCRWTWELWTTPPEDFKDSTWVSMVILQSWHSMSVC